METMEQRAQKRIAIVVDPDLKEWARKEAEKRKWSLSLYCRELLREAMAREAGRCTEDS